MTFSNVVSYIYSNVKNATKNDVKIRSTLINACKSTDLHLYFLILQDCKNKF